MSERDVLKQCIEANSGSCGWFDSLEQLKANTLKSPEFAGKPVDLSHALGLPETRIVDTGTKAAASGESLGLSKWQREMAAEVKRTLATVDDKIAAASLQGLPEAKIMRVGAERVLMPTFERPAMRLPPVLNSRQAAILEALNQHPGVEAELMKDSKNIYWIVARRIAALAERAIGPIARIIESI
jgi:hypothetical protein